MHQHLLRRVRRQASKRRFHGTVPGPATGMKKYSLRSPSQQQAVVVMGRPGHLLYSRRLALASLS